MKIYESIYLEMLFSLKNVINYNLSNYWFYNYIRPFSFSKFEHLFKKNMYSSTVRSIAQLKV